MQYLDKKLSPGLNPSRLRGGGPYLGVGREGSKADQGGRGGTPPGELGGSSGESFLGKYCTPSRLVCSLLELFAYFFPDGPFFLNLGPRTAQIEENGYRDTGPRN